jgi:signal transduction histidine kinase
MLEQLIGRTGDAVGNWRVRLLPRRASAPLVAALTVGVVRSSGGGAHTGRVTGLRWMVRDISDQVRAEQARAELRHLLASVQEEERRCIARELHDETGQHLAALTLGLKALEAASWGRRETLDLIGQMRGITDRLGRDIHQIALQLRPTSLDDLGLPDALSGYVEEWAQRAGIVADVHVAGLKPAARLPPAIETALYRAIQEALTNVVKHARARRVSVIVERRDNHVLAIVEDDGVGFDSDAALRRAPGTAGAVAERRLGLLGIKERMAQVGGTFTIESSPGHGGATLFLRIPLPGSATGRPPATANEAEETENDDAPTRQRTPRG